MAKNDVLFATIFVAGFVSFLVQIALIQNGVPLLISLLFFLPLLFAWLLYTSWVVRKVVG